MLTIVKRYMYIYRVQDKHQNPTNINAYGSYDRTQNKTRDVGAGVKIQVSRI